MICTAHPQSIDATEAMEPTVFASINRTVRIYPLSNPSCKVMNET